MIRLYKADCLPAMREMPGKAYDLAIDSIVILCYCDGNNSQ